MFPLKLGQENSIILSLGEETLTSENCVLNQFEISCEMGSAGADLNLGFRVYNPIISSLAGVKRIRDKTIAECTIEELLFAVRKKIELSKK